MKRRETSAAEYLRGGPAPVIVVTHFRDMAQFGRALALGARGRWFESSYPDLGFGGGIGIHIRLKI